MLNRDFKPRLDFNKLQTNVIMAQIRAQKQKRSIKIVQPVLIAPKQTTGRKHFQRNQFKITDISNTITNQHSRSASKSTGKKLLNRCVSLTLIESTRSPGKKKFQEKHQKTNVIVPITKAKRQIQIPKISFGRKRVDLSPSNQQRESSNSPLHWNKHLF